MVKRLQQAKRMNRKIENKLGLPAETLLAAVFQLNEKDVVRRINYMLKVPVENAVGMVLCHDITKIVPGQFKGRAFKKGHVVTEEDIPELLRMCDVF
jgi:hypothetical protein